MIFAESIDIFICCNVQGQTSLCTLTIFMHIMNVARARCVHTCARAQRVRICEGIRVDSGALGPETGMFERKKEWGVHVIWLRIAALLVLNGGGGGNEIHFRYSHSNRRTRPSNENAFHVRDPLISNDILWKLLHTTVRVHVPSRVCCRSGSFGKWITEARAMKFRSV